MSDPTPMSKYITDSDPTGVHGFRKAISDLCKDMAVLSGAQPPASDRSCGGPLPLPNEYQITVPDDTAQFKPFYNVERIRKTVLLINRQLPGAKLSVADTHDGVGPAESGVTIRIPPESIDAVRETLKAHGEAVKQQVDAEFSPHEAYYEEHKNAIRAQQRDYAAGLSKGRMNMPPLDKYLKGEGGRGRE